MDTQIRERFSARFVAGSALMVTGALLMLQQAGLLHAIDMRRNWPLVIIVLAIAKLLTTIRDEHQQGWRLLLLGDWLYLNTMTDWSISHITGPILITAVGAWMIVRAVGTRSRPLLAQAQQERQFAT